MLEKSKKLEKIIKKSLFFPFTNNTNILTIIHYCLLMFELFNNAMFFSSELLVLRNFINHIDKIQNELQHHEEPFIP